MKQAGKTTALRWLWRVSGKSKYWMLLRTLMRTAQGLVAIFYAHSLGKVVDAAASGSRDAFAREMSWFAVYTVSSILLMLLNRYLQEKSKNTLEKTFCLRAFSQLLYRDYGAISKSHNGEWMTRITSDTNVIATAISQILPETVSALVRVGGALLALHQILPQVTWILIPGGLLMAGVSFLLQKRLKHFHKNVQRADGRARSFIQERLYSLLVIHAFTQESVTRDMASEKYDELNAARMRRHRFVLVCAVAVNGAMVTAQLLGIGMCGLGILNGTLSYGAVSTVLYLINMLEAPLNTISAYVSQYYGMIASAERLMEIETLGPDTEEEPVSPGEVQKYYSESFAALGLEKADFAYEEGEENAVLEDFSIEIRKGDYVAFTGESGCGKSTTLKLLLGLYPLDGGSAYLQDADGTRQPLNGAWRGLFAYVPQGNQLISGTVRETLTFGNPDQMLQDEKLYRALEIACADGFVRDLPKGLDTVLGERGSGLSEGQVQRLSTARALLTERPILLLDESTSALDAATEEQLLKNLRAMTDRTVLIITHRPAALAICDRQIHFEKTVPTP